MSIPRKLPFWERRREQGPLTSIVQSQAKLAAQAAEREALLANPQRALGSYLPDDGYEKRAVSGKCVNCGDAAAEGKRRCERHLEASREYTRRQWAAKAGK